MSFLTQLWQTCLQGILQRSNSFDLFLNLLRSCPSLSELNFNSFIQNLIASKQFLSAIQVMRFLPPSNLESYYSVLPVLFLYFHSKAKRKN